MTNVFKRQEKCIQVVLVPYQDENGEITVSRKTLGDKVTGTLLRSTVTFSEGFQTLENSAPFHKGLEEPRFTKLAAAINQKAEELLRPLVAPIEALYECGVNIAFPRTASLHAIAWRAGIVFEVHFEHEDVPQDILDQYNREVELAISNRQRFFEKTKNMSEEERRRAEANYSRPAPIFHPRFSRVTEVGPLNVIGTFKVSPKHPIEDWMPVEFGQLRKKSGPKFGGKSGVSTKLGDKLTDAKKKKAANG